MIYVSWLREEALTKKENALIVLTSLEINQLMFK